MNSRDYKAPMLVVVSSYAQAGFGGYAEGVGTVRASGGDYGGGTETLIVETYQTITGPLMANSHPGSYCGQDAYSDMLITGGDNGVGDGVRTGECRNNAGGVSNNERKP